MEKNSKKNLEHTLLKETEKIFFNVDATASAVFSKYIKNHCKDLAKKFSKVQKKLQKKLEEMNTVTEHAKENFEKKAPQKNILVSKLKKTSALSKADKITEKNPPLAKKTVIKRPRKGNNLMNAATVQKKAKLDVAKSIVNSAKKK